MKRISFQHYLRMLNITRIDCAVVEPPLSISLAFIGSLSNNNLHPSNCGFGVTLVFHNVSNTLFSPTSKVLCNLLYAGLTEKTSFPSSFHFQVSGHPFLSLWSFNNRRNCSIIVVSQTSLYLLQDRSQIHTFTT